MKDLRTGKKLHLGCGERKLSGFINVDIRKTQATDYISDCITLKDFTEKTYELIVANAFFEHLTYLEAEKLLIRCRELLVTGGILLIGGIPDFKKIAKCYLRKSRGITSDTFNISQVYRYTHGEESLLATVPEMQHKSLWDVESLSKIIRKYYPSYSIFSYCWGNEKQAVNLGFVASTIEDEVLEGLNFECLNEYGLNINLDTIEVRT